MPKNPKSGPKGFELTASEAKLQKVDWQDLGWTVDMVPKYSVGKLSNEDSEAMKKYMEERWSLMDKQKIEFKSNPIADIEPPLIPYSAMTALLNKIKAEKSALNFASGGPIVMSNMEFYKPSDWCTEHCCKPPTPEQIEAKRQRNALAGLFKDVHEPASCPAYGTMDAEEQELGGIMGCLSSTSVWFRIQHLNDRHKWTREQIADWLESLDLDLTIKENQDEQD